jgi:hypothetical protein
MPKSANSPKVRLPSFVGRLSSVVFRPSSFVRHLWTGHLNDAPPMCGRKRLAMAAAEEEAGDGKHRQGQGAPKPGLTRWRCFTGFGQGDRRKRCSRGCGRHCRRVSRYGCWTWNGRIHWRGGGWRNHRSAGGCRYLRRYIGWGWRFCWRNRSGRRRLRRDRGGCGCICCCGGWRWCIGRDIECWRRSGEGRTAYKKRHHGKNGNTTENNMKMSRFLTH